MARHEPPVTSRPMSSDTDASCEPVASVPGTDATSSADAPERGRLRWGLDERAWKQTRLALIAIYLVAYVWWFVARGIIVDRISVSLSVVLFLIVSTVGRSWHDWLRLGRDAGLFVLMWLAYRMFDRLTPEVDFAEELKKGNVAVAIFIGALFISIALIVGRALN